MTRTWSVLKRTWQGWQKDDGFLLSAAMAYYGALSLFPLLLVLMAVLGMVLRFWPVAQNQQEQLLTLLSQNDPWLAQQLGAVLAGVKARAGLGGPIGAATLLAAAVGVFVQLDYVFDRIWSIPPSSKHWLAYVRSVLWDRVSAFLMLLGVSGLLLAVLVANVVLAGVWSYVVQLPAGNLAWEWSQTGLTLIVNTLLFGTVYKVLPKVRVCWRHAMVGGLFVSLVWLLGQHLLVSFVIGTSYNAYGVVGSFMAIMLWLYYASSVIFLGAELVRAVGQECPLCGKTATL
jgi:membrane protein